MSTPIPSVIAVGLVKAGKSTYIAALSYVIQSQEIPTRLKLHKLDDALDYVNLLVADWLQCKEFERTKGGAHGVAFHLKDGEVPVGTIAFPDISGETFEEQWNFREWEHQFASLAKNAAGILFFVHPLHVVKPFSKVDSAAVLAAAMGTPNGDAVTEDVSAPSTNSTAAPKSPESELWEPKLAAPQSKLVDILQMIAWNTDPRQRPIRTGVLISAWDIVTSAVVEPPPPEKWLRESAPLLHQYLTMNPELFDWRTFGVSAQGGDNKRDGNSLRHLDEPSKRVRIDGAEGSEHDITWPLAWVLKSNGT
jgi:hypothetical protein